MKTEPIETTTSTAVVPCHSASAINRAASNKGIPTKFITCAAALSLVLAAALISAKAFAAGPPVHEVRGQGVLFDAGPESDSIDTITISAWEDETGVHGVATFVSEWFFQEDTQYLGWAWVIDVDTLVVSENEAYVAGVVVQDTKFPESEGLHVDFIVKDNGQGAADPPDEIFDSRISGGNFIVR